MNKLARLATTITLAASLFGCATRDVSPAPDTVSAVLVGIGYTCDKEELQKKGSAMDVASVYETLRYCYSGATHYYDDTSDTRKHYEYIFDPTIDCRILQDDKATTANVKGCMRNAMSSDLAIIYFSVKATQVPATDASEADGLDECLRLYDGLLSDNEIWEILQTARGRVFIVFDTGHSQTMLKSVRGENLLMDLVDDVANPVVPTKNENPDILCWSACLDADNIDERSIGSRMTNAFYFKSDRWYTYEETFDRMLKSVGDKQKLNKTVLGTSFEDRTMFR